MAQTAVQEQRPNSMQSLMYGKEIANRLTFDTAHEMYHYFHTAMLRPLIMGELDQGKFEDQAREMFGIQSFVLFTLDKLVLQLTRQVRRRHRRHRRRGGALPPLRFGDAHIVLANNAVANALVVRDLVEAARAALV